MLWRAACDAVATMVYLTARVHLPIGNATAINLATPLCITLMAMLTLGERGEEAEIGVPGRVGLLASGGVFAEVIDGHHPPDGLQRTGRPERVVGGRPGHKALDDRAADGGAFDDVTDGVGPGQAEQGGAQKVARVHGPTLGIR